MRLQLEALRAAVPAAGSITTNNNGPVNNGVENYYTGPVNVFSQPSLDHLTPEALALLVEKTPALRELIVKAVEQTCGVESSTHVRVSTAPAPKPSTVNRVHGPEPRVFSRTAL